MNNHPVVLPDTLVAQLIDNAATLSKYLKNDFAQIIAQREKLRARLIYDQKIIKITSFTPPLSSTYAIDGAHLAEIDRASAYSASCAVRVGQANQVNGQSSCLAILPHVACLNALSSGLMMMQEIMMTVEAAESNPDTICLIDGSRISAIINIQSFYSGIVRDMSNQLQIWRLQGHQEPDREPGRTIRLFESRDWMTPYLTSTQIIGNLKLVTTNVLINKYIPDWVGRFDDKTFAALVLEDCEVIEPIPIPAPDEPFHIHDAYPYSDNIDRINSQLTQNNHPNRLFHIYYKPDTVHGVYKIEVNSSFLVQQNLVAGMFSWWRCEIDAPDLMEPYSFYIADRFAKEAVSVSKGALKEITRRDVDVGSISYFFLQSYRTE